MPPAITSPTGSPLRKIALIGLAIGLTTSWAAGGEHSPPPEPEEVGAFLDEWLPRAMIRERIPGLAVVVLVGDSEVLRGYGYANRELCRPVDPQRTLFPVGSISKLITTTAAMQVAERDLLRLDDDVATYLDGDLSGAAALRGVKIWHLLTHTAGFESRRLGITARHWNEIQPLERFLDRSLPPQFSPPGNVICYSNHGIALVGLVLERLRGAPFERIVREHILDPLEMTRSGFTITPAVRNDLAVGYDLKHGELTPAPLDFTQIAPSGSLFTSADEFAHFLSAHLHGGIWQDRRILSAASAQAMTRRQFSHHPMLPGFGYGFCEHLEDGVLTLRHIGLRRGFTSWVLLAPRAEIAALITFNRVLPGFGNAFFSELIGRFHPPAEPVPSLPGEDAPLLDPRTLAGRYQLVGCPRDTVEKLSALTKQLSVRADGAWGVRLASSGARWDQVAPGVFDNGHEKLIFSCNSAGEVERLFVRRRAYDRVAWHQDSRLHLIAFAAFFLFFAGAALRWMLPGLCSRLRGTAPAARSTGRPLGACVGLLALLNCAFLVGLPVVIRSTDDAVFAYGIPTGMLTLLLLPLLSALMAAVAAACCIRTWRRRKTPLCTRLQTGAVVLATVAFALLLDYWNLFGFQG